MKNKEKEGFVCPHDWQPTYVFELGNGWQGVWLLFACMECEAVTAQKGKLV